MTGLQEKQFWGWSAGPERPHSKPSSTVNNSPGDPTAQEYTSITDSRSWWFIYIISHLYLGKVLKAQKGTGTNTHITTPPSEQVLAFCHFAQYLLKNYFIGLKFSLFLPWCLSFSMPRDHQTTCKTEFHHCNLNYEFQTLHFHRLPVCPTWPISFSLNDLKIGQGVWALLAENHLKSHLTVLQAGRGGGTLKEK